MDRIKNNYNHTLNACYLGYITQAIINNFAPLLFLTFQKSSGISLSKISLLVTLNFGIQLIVDFFAAKFVDKIGYRICKQIAHVCAGFGLIGMAILPEFLSNQFWGLVIAIILYAVGGGLIEVLISPIVEACPTDRKEAAMSILHSFYCWGHVGVILISTLFFTLIGIHRWKLLAILWSLIPFLNAAYFSLVPLKTLNEEENGLNIRQLFQLRHFWILVVLMMCAGASEQAVSQWASAFAESGLHISKTVGDLAGPCMFATLMGVSRILTAKFTSRFKLEHMMLLSSILCASCYLLIGISTNPLMGLMGCALCGFSVGILWPGTFSLAMQKIPLGGTAMFAFFALAGDIGCATGPALVGLVSEVSQNNIRMGILFAIIFPIFLLIGLLLLRKNKLGS
ncbi:MAG: MFS transporter [Lachnospiraceae bacterium]